METRTRAVASTRLTDIRRVVRDFKEYVRTIKMHPLDPEEVNIGGKIVFTKPLPLRKAVFLEPFSKEIKVVTEASELFIDTIEFIPDNIYVKAEVGLLTSENGETVGTRITCRSYVDALTLFFMLNGYEMLATEHAQADEEVKTFIAAVHAAIEDILRKGVDKYLDAREVFYSAYKSGNSGYYAIFEYGDWESASFMFEWNGFYDEKYVGLDYYNGRVYIGIYDAYLTPINTVGIDSLGGAKYKIKSSTLKQLPIGEKLVENYFEGKKLLKEYFELAKLVFLGVKAYVI